MLALDDPRWHELTHAYGAASDIPPLIEQLSANTSPVSGYRSEPWFSLWSALCHQGNVYTASYAAMPHIVRIAHETKTPVDFSFFYLPACIEIARIRHRGPEIPSDLASSYRDAISRIVEVIALRSGEPWDTQSIRSITAALAVAKGDVDLAEAISNLDDYWIGKINNFDYDE